MSKATAQHPNSSLTPRGRATPHASPARFAPTTETTTCPATRLRGDGGQAARIPGHGRCISIGAIPRGRRRRAPAPPATCPPRNRSGPTPSCPATAGGLRTRKRYRPVSPHQGYRCACGSLSVPCCADRVLPPFPKHEAPDGTYATPAVCSTYASYPGKSTSLPARTDNGRLRACQPGEGVSLLATCTEPPKFRPTARGSGR